MASSQELSKPVEFTRQTSLPVELHHLENSNPATDRESIFHLNTMLKSLILPQSTISRDESQNIIEEVITLVDFVF